MVSNGPLPTAPLSHRITSNLAFSSPLFNGIRELLKNPYDRDTNPDGILNLGVAENRLLHHKLESFVRSKAYLTRRQFCYGLDPAGSPRFRGLIADLINRNFSPVWPVQADHVTVHNGTSSAIDIFAFATCDVGEGILVAAPCYGGFGIDVQMRAKAQLIPVPMTVDQMLNPAEHVRCLAQAYTDAITNGIAVRAMIVCTPHNPLGVSYSRPLMEAILHFASERNLHVLSDEIYALSTFNNEFKALGHSVADVRAHEALAPHNRTVSSENHTFCSVLSLPNLADLIDPSLVHVIHGVSKDFCMNGMRVGYLVSPWNPQLIAAVRTVSNFSWNSAMTEDLMIEIFSSVQWFQGFIDENRQALAQAYAHAARFLVRHRIPYIPSRAGHFVWIDLRQFCTANSSATTNGHGFLACTPEQEKVLFKRLIDHKVYVTLGQAFSAQESGWFRLTFTLPLDDMNLGLSRLAKALGV
ncbi:hypothetical protein H4R34_003585 [Dimargaris verticillata]|uniref:Aminotransferase class I/classII large domain-containing protein n=1 Tax=Dimargaris verticillata TaxID=2761393 RepID=A0A9W8B0F2_9FUNG|nr:hypothetical protein H4R34_003585 [Dimargaris verticillata]